MADNHQSIESYVRTVIANGGPLNGPPCPSIARGQIDALINIFPDAALFSTFGEGEVLDANSVFINASGYSREELIGKSVHQLQPWEVPADRERYYKLLCRDGHCNVLETRLRGQGRHTVWVSVFGRLIDCEGRLCLLSFFHDISPRKQAEEALRASEERYALAVKLARVGLWDWDPISDSLKTEPFFYELLGLAPTDTPTTSKQMIQLIHPDDIPLVEKRVDAYLKGETPFFESEHRLLHFDGSERWVFIRGRAVDSPAEDGQRVVGTFTDITERKMAQLNLQESQGHFQSLMDSAETFTIYRLIGDESSPNRFKVEMVSPSARKIMGLEEHEDIKRCFEHIHPDDIEQVNKANRQALKTGRFNETFRIIQPRTGQVRWIHAIGNGEVGADGELLFANGVAYDITERKRVEEKEAAHQSRLRELALELSNVEDRQRRRIATDLHDGVGQMLAAAKIRLMALENFGDREANAESLAEIRKMLEEAMAQIRSLTVELSPPVLYELGLPAALEWLCEDLTARHGLKIQLRDARAAADLEEEMAALLFRAVRELLHNVIKHADAEKVQVQVLRQGRRIGISVIDDGRGFTAEGDDQQSPGRSSRFGLFSIRERLEYLGGEMLINTRTGHGAKVVLWAPPDP